jgi:hypothetical protein
MSEVGVAYVTLAVSSSGIGQQIAGELGGVPGIATNAGDAAGKGFAGKMGAHIKSLAGPLALTLGAAAVGKFFGDAIEGASNFAEQGAAVAQVFGEEGSAALQKLAETSATSFGMSKDQLLEAAKTFGVYGKAANLSGEENAKFSSDLVGLATDLASFNNTSVDDAILALGAGLRGESEPLKRFGVLMDENSLKAQALKMGIVDLNVDQAKLTKAQADSEKAQVAYNDAVAKFGPNSKQAQDALLLLRDAEEKVGAAKKGKIDQLTQEQKVLAAQGLIMEQTATQQGDFARTSEGLANQQRIMEANTKNLGIAVGTLLLPAMTALTEAGNFLLTMFTGLATWIGENLPVVGTFVGILGAWLVATNAIRIATGVWAAVQAVFNAVMALNPITLIVIAIAALVAAIVWVATKTTFFQDVWTAMVDAIMIAWDAVVGFFEDSFAAIGGWFSDIWKGAKKSWDTFAKWIGNAVKVIGDVFGGIFKFVGDIFKGTVNGWLGIIETFINFFINGVNELLKAANAGLGFLGDLIGQKIEISLIPKAKLPRLAQGGVVYPRSGGVPALLAEAGQPEVITPLSDFQQMMNNGNGKTIIYNAAPNASLDAETELLRAMRRAEVIAGW